MPTAPVSSDWTSRSVPEAWGPERLAAYVEGALSGADGMLFTATPREELDGIGRFQQLKDQAWVGQVRAIVAAWNRATDAQREFAADEVALAIGVAPGTGAKVVGIALSAAALPGLLEAVSAGMLTERHVMSVLRELDAQSLLLEQRQAIVMVALARYAGEAPGEFGRVVQRLILLIDLPAAKEREQHATAARRVRFYPDADGQAVLHARGPLAMIAAIKASLEATLGERQDGDDRCREEREFDLFVELLTGSQVPSGWHAHVIVPFTTALGGETELADVPGFGPILPGTAKDLLDDAVAFTQVAVDETGAVFAVSDPLTPAATPAPAQSEAAAASDIADAPVAADRAQTPAPPTADETPDAPADARVADDTTAPTAPTEPTPAHTEPTAAQPVAAEQADVPTKAVTADAIREAILAMGRVPAAHALGATMGTSAYRVPARVQRFLEARDRTCVFPGCGRPASQTDKDHRTPWPAGATEVDNLQCLCRHHHRAKQTVFTVEQIDGDYRWTTRGGWMFWRRRQGY
jgi:hypothetical protein